ncbi:hypothetical protein C8Q70DRAFT_1056286 [Cubamyces menziesii]|uniref:Uncharacterized protein n=1 Tax=Trametes cubensis TaxID=1111947 RepID=A0AAD7XHJ9_9APHY|nr:hypothetical protein C8Q70DRAFT_1056286 [Cubamyces menziesii]KAJ8495737.1 hypothetical protein ONZ51_g1529 [Trametes cubensis]
MSPVIDGLRLFTQVEPRPGSRTAGDAGNSAAVNGSAAVCYMAGVTAQMKEDVMYSTLLAQVEADTMYPGRSMDERLQWHSKYWAVLRSLGWTTRTFSEVEIDNASAYGSVDRLVVQISGAELEGSEYNMFLDMIDALRGPVNSEPLSVFDRTAVHDGHDASFQIGVVSNLDGNALFKCGAHQYHTAPDTPISSALLFSFEAESETEVPYYAVNQTMELNVSFYATVRDTVKEQLAGVVQNMFRDIEM